MQLESPHLPNPVPATYDSIAELVPRLLDAEDPFAIVMAAEMTYAQVLCTPAGFVFEYQVDTVDQHFRSVRDDLTVEETIAALNTYASGAPIWSLGLEFNRIEVQSIWYRMGRRIGFAFGSVKRLTRRLVG